MSSSQIFCATNIAGQPTYLAATHDSDSLGIRVRKQRRLDQCFVVLVLVIETTLDSSVEEKAAILNGFEFTRIVGIVNSSFIAVNRLNSS